MSLGQRPGLVKDHHIGLVQPFQSERILYPDMHIGGFAYPRISATGVIKPNAHGQATMKMEITE